MSIKTFVSEKSKRMHDRFHVGKSGKMLDGFGNEIKTPKTFPVMNTRTGNEYASVNEASRLTSWSVYGIRKDLGGDGLEWKLLATV